MGIVENVISAVILMLLLLVSGLIYFGSFAGDAARTAGVKHDVFFDDIRINDLNTVLKITEPVSGRNMGVLMADAVYYRNETLEFNKVVINVTDRVVELMNFSFAGNDYYMEVRPRIIEVSMNFVIDGSPSLTQEREMLASYLPSIMTSIEAKLNETNEGYSIKVSKTPVISNIYLLGSKPEKCNLFNNLSDSRVKCMVLSASDLYLKNTSINMTTTFINNSRFNLEAFLNFYNMTPPFGFAWLNRDTYLGQSDYADSDWGYGMGYASNFDKKTTLSRLTILFPMGDELSTSSFPDECFFYNDWPHAATCTLCVDNCSVDRSWTSVLKGLEIAKDNNHVINPIYSYNCDYNYTSDYEVAYEAATGATPSGNICDESDCYGCTHSGSEVCFQPGCADDVLEQMDYIANQTGGRIIDIADIGTMDINITNTIIDNIDQYSLIIGEKETFRERDVIETTQPLPNGEFVDIRLWVYKN